MKKAFFTKIEKFGSAGLLFVCLTIYLSVAYPLGAQSPTSKPTVVPSQNQVPTEAEDIERIQRIKDIVASKVAELNLVEKRGIIGTVKEIDKMEIVIMDIKGSTRQIEVDELTKFNIAKTASDISDLKTGVQYSFVGLYNKETKKLLARTVGNVTGIPVQLEGAISSIEAKEFQIEIVNAKGETKKVDIENSTKTNLASPDGDLVKSGFSKLEENSRILVVGFLDEDDDELITATRVIHFEDVPPSKEMQSHITLATPTPEED